jgi:hypothetical protein
MIYSQQASQAYELKYYATARFFFKLTLNDDSDSAFNSPYLIYAYADTCLKCGMYSEAHALFNQLSNSHSLPEFMIALCKKKLKKLSTLETISPVGYHIHSNSPILFSIVDAMRSVFEYIQKPITLYWIADSFDFYNHVDAIKDDLYCSDDLTMISDALTLTGESYHYIFLSVVWMDASVDALIGLLAQQLTQIELLDNYFYNSIKDDNHIDPITQKCSQLIADLIVLSKGYAYELMSAREFILHEHHHISPPCLSPTDIFSYFIIR